MLKRTLLASLFGIALVGFVGCGGEETAPPVNTDVPTTTTDAVVVEDDVDAIVVTPADETPE